MPTTRILNEKRIMRGTNPPTSKNPSPNKCSFCSACSSIRSKIIFESFYFYKIAFKAVDPYCGSKDSLKTFSLREVKKSPLDSSSPSLEWSRCRRAKEDLLSPKPSAPSSLDQINCQRSRLLYDCPSILDLGSLEGGVTSIPLRPSPSTAWDILGWVPSLGRSRSPDNKSGGFWSTLRAPELPPIDER